MIYARFYISLLYKLYAPLVDLYKDHFNLLTMLTALYSASSNYVELNMLTEKQHYVVSLATKVTT